MKGGAPVGIAFDSTNVYWGDRILGVFKAPLTGGVGTVVTPLGTPAFVVGDMQVYFLTNQGSAGIGLFSVSLDGSSLALLADLGGATTSNLALDSAFIYLADGTELVRVPRSGGSETTLAGNNPIAVAVDATNVYWVDSLGRVVQQHK